MPSVQVVSQIAHAQPTARPVRRTRRTGVPRGVDLLPFETVELAAYERVMRLEEVAPAAVAELHGAVCRLDDVDEQRRGEHPIRSRPRRFARDELLEGGEHAVVVGHEHVVVAGKLEKARVRDGLGDVPGAPDVGQHVVGAMHDQRRDMDARQDRAEVGLERHLRVGACSRGAGGGSQVTTPPRSKLLVAGQRREEQLDPNGSPQFCSMASRCA
jgi:hypothetical protein